MSRFSDPQHRSVWIAVFGGVPYRGNAARGRWPCVELRTEPGDAVPEEGSHAADAVGSLVADAVRGDGSASYIVEPERLDAWYESSWTFRWRGGLFRSVGSRGGQIRGEYLGDDEDFRRAYVDTYGEGVFPLDEVGELVEQRKDLIELRRERERLYESVGWYRPGTYAVYRGERYSASEFVAEGYRHLTIGLSGEMGSARTVPLEEVEEWYTSSWTFTSDGEHFDVLGVVDGLIHGRYTGRQHYFAWNMCHRETDAEGRREIYTLSQSPDDVDDLTERRVDLLALASVSMPHPTKTQPQKSSGA